MSKESFFVIATIYDVCVYFVSVLFCFHVLKDSPTKENNRF